jgi:hypothetical protein
MVVHNCNFKYLGVGGKRIVSLKPNQAVSEILSWKQNTNKKAWGKAYVVEHLPSMHIGSGFGLQSCQGWGERTVEKELEN